MSLIGSKNSFAVQTEVTEKVDDWVFGTFVFWLGNKLVGDLDDSSVDLKGCLNWIKDFLSRPKNRFEPGLYEMDKDQAFIQLCGSVILRDHQDAFFAQEKYNDTFSRFHISHLGMSSFDNLNLLLVENEQGLQRVLWQQGDEEVDDAYLLKNELSSVLKKTEEFLVSEIVPN